MEDHVTKDHVTVTLAPSTWRDFLKALREAQGVPLLRNFAGILESKLRERGMEL